MNCPKCNQQLSYLRRPDSLGQLLTGGWTCPNCQTVLDAQGRALAGPHKTVAAALLLVLLFGGIALSNYFVFFLNRSGLGMGTLVLTLGLVFLGLKYTKPNVHPNLQDKENAGKRQLQTID